MITDDPIAGAGERKLRALVEALKALVGHARFEVAFAEFVRGMKERLGVTKAGLLQFDAARGAFGMFPGLHSDFDEAECRRMLARVSRNAAAFLAGGVGDAAPPRLFRYREGRLHMALYLLPLRLREEFAGVLLLSKPYAGEETYLDDQIFLSAIGDQVATFLERARLFARIEADRRRMEFLYALARDLSAPLDPSEVAKTAAARVLAEFPFACVALLVFDESDGFRFHLRARRRIAPRREAEILRDLKENLKAYLPPHEAERMRETRRESAADEPAAASRAETAASWSCLLQYNDVLSGIFAVYGPAAGGRLATPETQRILSTAGIQISAALQNASLFKKTKLLSITDAVTRLYNHRHFLQTLEAEASRVERYGTRLSLAMADIDHFKRFNDTYGHKTGDEVLFRVGETIKRAAREIDTVARYGGEEFAVVMPETSLEGACRLAERVRKMIQGLRVQTAAGPLSVTLSLGVAEMQPGLHPAVLVERADEALYAAKEGGRDAVYFRDRSGAIGRFSPPPGQERHAGKTRNRAGRRR